MRDRELDILMAKEIMGAEFIDLGPNPHIRLTTGPIHTWAWKIDDKYYDDEILKGHPLAVGNWLPNYSTDIVAAWDVVEKMPFIEISPDMYGSDHTKLPIVITFLIEDKKWEIKFSDCYWINELETKDTSLPRCICLAALKAKGIEVKK